MFNELEAPPVSEPAVEQQPAGAPDTQAAETPPVAPAVVATPARVRDANGRFTKEEKKEAFLARQREIVAGAEALAAEAAAVVDAVEQQVEPTEHEPEGDDSPPAAPVAAGSEGPSPDMVAIAEALGVPKFAIAMAKSDDALQMAIAVAAPHLAETGDVEDSVAPQQLPQPGRLEPGTYEAIVPEEFRVKSLIPDDYGDPDDPLVQQNKHLVDTVRDLQMVVSQLAGDVLATKSERQQQRTASLQASFDDILDKSEWPGVGKRAELKSHEQMEVRVRSKLFDAFEDLSRKLPGIPSEQVVELAYQQVFKRKPATKKTPQEAARVAAIQRSNRQILGSGSGGPSPPEPKLSPQERFLRNVERIRAQRG